MRLEDFQHIIYYEERGVPFSIRLEVTVSGPGLSTAARESIIEDGFEFMWYLDH